MKKVLLISFLFALMHIQAQEVRLGLTVGTTPLKRVLWDEAIYTPDNSYYTYVEKQNGAGLINSYHPFNAFNIGAILNFSIRKFSFNMEPQYFFERSVYRFEKPNTIKRVVGAKGFRMPIYFTYKFFKKENSSYLVFGWNITKVNHWDFQHPTEGYYFSGEEIYQGDPDFGDDHFEGVLYDDQTAGALILGLGKQFKVLNSSLRFQVPTRKADLRLPSQSWRWEWTFSWFFLSTKDFTNKHPLYIE